MNNAGNRENDHGDDDEAPTIRENERRIVTKRKEYSDET